jgi:NADH-quinone oxidoreductase subunit H
MNEILFSLILIFVVLFGVLTVAANLIWLERRLLALWQDRYGPNRVGPFGLFQTIADAIKMFLKEDWIPPFADKAVFILAPCIINLTALLAFAVIPFAPGVQIADLSVGLLFLMAMSSLGVYSVTLAGWASNNKYSLLGGMRASAQMLAYEVYMGLSLMGVVLMAGSLNIGEIVKAQEGMWFCLPQFFGMILFFIAGTAETHRLPFDLPEAEAELVAGFHAEYSSMKFGMFFIGEYVGVTLISLLTVLLYFGGWAGPLFGAPDYLTPFIQFGWLALKTLVLISLFILMRASLARPRYDQLIEFGWKIMLPLALLNLMGTGAILLALR